MRARVLFAKDPDETQPIVVAATDASIWEHVGDSVFAGIRAEWPAGYEWAEAWLDIDDANARLLFPATPQVRGRIVESFAEVTDRQGHR